LERTALPAPFFTKLNNVQRHYLQRHGLSLTVINKFGKYRAIFTYALTQLTATPTMFMCTIKIGRKNVEQSDKIFVRPLRTI
jgi:hypothetical protein